MWAVVMSDSDGELWRVVVATEAEGVSFLLDSMMGCGWPCGWVIPVAVALPCIVNGSSCGRVMSVPQGVC